MSPEKLCIWLNSENVTLYYATCEEKIVGYLLDKRDAFRRDELLRAMINSDRTYEEMLAFLENGKKKEEIKNGNKADGRHSRKIKRDDRR